MRKVLLLAAFLLPGVTAGPAWAVRYVALGDSYSSGTGTGAYYDAACQRSVLSYPHRVHRAHPSWAFVHAACSGAKTGDVIDAQSASLTPETDWVTYTVGGNDAGFASVIAECAQPWWSSDCDAAIERAQAYIATTLPGRLDLLNGRIRSRSPSATVIALSYPHLFMGQDCDAATFFSPDEESRLNQTADMLRDKIRAASRRAGPNFVSKNAIRRFAGHAVCDSAPWLNGLSSPIGESYHPNRAGHRRGYTKLVRAVLG